MSHLSFSNVAEVNYANVIAFFLDRRTQLKLSYKESDVVMLLFFALQIIGYVIH